jgi:hypothetical protein
MRAWRGGHGRYFVRKENKKKRRRKRMTTASVIPTAHGALGMILAGTASLVMMRSTRTAQAPNKVRGLMARSGALLLCV